MAEAQCGQDGTSTIPQSGKVGSVCRQWLVHEDRALAQSLQDQEFGHKYEWNRQDRRTARVDVPFTRVCESREEEIQQKAAMEHVERQQAIAQQDAIAAEKMMSEMLLEEQRSRVQREMQDERIASVLQQQEKKHYEQKAQERALAKERKRLERELASQSDAILSAHRGEDNAQNVALSNHQKSLLRTDGKVEDLGDFSDFYIPPDNTMNESEAKNLQKMQDEELARLLQDQEHKRGAQINRDKLKAIEAQDEELARVMQEQEKLRQKKRQQKLAAKRQMSQQQRLSDHENPMSPRPHSDCDSIDSGDSRRNASYYAHNNGHHRMSPPLEQAPVPELMRSDDTYLPPQRNHAYPAPDYVRGVERERYVGRSEHQVSPQRSPQEGPNSYQPENYQSESHTNGAEGNVFRSIDPTVYPDQALSHSNGSRPTDGHQGDLQPGEKYQSQHSGEEDGYCALEDLAVVQGQRREGSGKSSARKNSKSKGQCKQQ